MLESISQGLAQGQRVELRGFGVFEKREHKARQARNPRTGETVIVDAKATARFKPEAIDKIDVDQCGLSTLGDLAPKLG